MKALILFTALALPYTTLAANEGTTHSTQTTEIHADTLHYTKKNHHIILKRHVSVKQPDTIASGNEAFVTLDKHNQVQRIILHGKPAHYKHQGKEKETVLSAQSITDYPKQGRVILSGHAIAIQGARRIMAGKMWYNERKESLKTAGGYTTLLLNPKE